ncbi:MAG: hypothetical protein EO766_16940 [Hydrotalea sp. AMD]|uniref:hypothetical protein n=1 Tax=Hydrotalea sp. AMD TaxID=2501297 RepID=UPI00102607B6|nr:hypothetical protein [Hydrotalea sp. AMD]RWZ84872.1 MAG: hypothetical protein EO766_16940 [Hydrotalea sp. AMD]
MAYDLIVPTLPIPIHNGFTVSGNIGWQGPTLDNGYYADNTGGTTPGILYSLTDPNATPIKLDHILYNASNTAGFKPTNQKAPLLVANNEIYSFYNGKMWVFNMQGQTIRTSPNLPASFPNLEQNTLSIFPTFGTPLQKPDGKVVFLAVYSAPSIYTTSTPGYLLNYLYCVEYSYSNFQIERKYTVYFTDKVYYKNLGATTFAYYFVSTGKRVFVFPKYYGSSGDLPLFNGDFAVELKGEQTTTFSRTKENSKANYFGTNSFYTAWSSGLTNKTLDTDYQLASYGSGNSLQLASYSPNNNYWQLINNTTQDPYLYAKGVNVSLLIPKTFYDLSRNKNVTVSSGVIGLKALNNNNRYGYFYTNASAGNYLFVPFIGKINPSIPTTNYTIGKEFK